MRSTVKKNETRRSGAGRPPIEINLEQIEQLSMIQCTDEEIAAVMGISTDTIGRRKKDDPDFLEAMEKGKRKGKASLRRLQWQLAQQGNPAMQIFLGKNILRQRDRFEEDSPDGIERARQIRDALINILDLDYHRKKDEAESGFNGLNGLDGLNGVNGGSDGLDNGPDGEPADEAGNPDDSGSPRA